MNERMDIPQGIGKEVQEQGANLNHEKRNAPEVEEVIREARRERINLKHIPNKDFYLMDIETRRSRRYGDYVILRDVEGTEYYTFSHRVLNQFNAIAEALRQSSIVKVRVKVDERNLAYLVRITQKKIEEEKKE